MSCTPAPACKAVLAQATALWPNRSRASDGICASPDHSATNPTSDHEVGNAVDLTHDPARGCDAHAWAERLRAGQDPRVKYIISRGQIVSAARVGSTPAWVWRPYGGSNPHTRHCHVSIYAAARTDTRPWFAAPNPQPLEDDMPMILWDPDHAWLLDGGRLVDLDDPVEKDRLKAAGVREVTAPQLVARLRAQAS